MDYRIDRAVDVGVTNQAALSDLRWVVMVFDEDGWCWRYYRHDGADDDLENKIYVKNWGRQTIILRLNSHRGSYC